MNSEKQFSVGDLCVEVVREEGLQLYIFELVQGDGSKWSIVRALRGHLREDE